MTARPAPPAPPAPTWAPEWLESEARRIAEPRVWRGVETQYASATTLLVDSHEEHDVLEQLLEASKPPLPLLSPRPPSRKPSLHFLLTTPFRYMPAHASRFREVGRHGFWYGATKLEAACAEVAYWRTRFIQDSVGLADEKIVTQHTFFAATVDGRGIDLMAPPWDAFRAAWTHDDDYSATHRLANAAEAAGIELIRYESARAPGQPCVAVFTPDALREPRGGLDATRQKWVCTATQGHVMMMAEDDRQRRFEWGR